MRKSASCVVLLATVWLGGCGGDTPESISNEMLATFNEMATVLEGITDEASAKAAVPKIEAVRAKMQDIGRRAKPLKTDAATEKKIEETIGPKMAQAQAALTSAMGKLMTKPELLKIIEPAMQNMEGDL